MISDIHKMDQKNVTDLCVLEIFRILDKAKCFITDQNVEEAWNGNKISFSLEQVLESFNIVTKEEYEFREKVQDLNWTNTSHFVCARHRLK